MHYIALLAERMGGGLTALSEDWVGVWAASEISFKQLAADISQLEVQLNKVETELKIVSTTTPPLPHSQPIIKRLEGVVAVHKPTLLKMKSGLKEVEGDLDKLLGKWGETLKGGEDDGCKKFFTTLSEFLKSFKQSAEENAQRKAEAEKSKEVTKESANTEDGASSPKGGVGAKKKGENLFGKFHDAQKASAGDVLAEFKMRMAKGKGK